VSASPDTTALLEALGHLLRQVTRLTGGADDGPAMTATQRIALVELGQAGPFRLNDLAQRIGTSTPTASRAVDALEALGLAARAPEAGDRRALSIDLTPRGRALLDARLSRAARVFEPATRSLTDAERRRLLALLRRMTEALRDDSP
jgi:DNA-binding MarR family transcriptional regulator